MHREDSPAGLDPYMLAKLGCFGRWFQPNPTGSSARPSERAAATASSAVYMAASNTGMAQPHLEDRVLGSLLGCMCGDVLGAGVEGWPNSRILVKYPEGVTDFLRTDRPYGKYTDDAQMTIALARSLVQQGRCDGAHAAATYAAAFEPWRGYGATAQQIMYDLSFGAEWQSVAEKYIPGGSYGNGGAMRIAPVGFAYRNAPPQVLHKAVVAALACTHVHPAAIDGALAQAVATAWLSRAPDSFRSDPAASLQFLAAVKAAVRTDKMQAKVGVIEEAVRKLHAAAAVTRDGAGEAVGKAPVAVAVAGADEGAAAKPQAAVVPAGAEENAAEEAQAALPSAGAEAGVVQPPAGAAAGAEAEEGAVAKLQAAVASAGAQEGVGPPPGGAAAAAVAAEPGANGPKQCGTEFKLEFESPAWEVELAAAFKLDTGRGFQIRATDAVACSLLALCMHWTQPEQAVIAAVHYGGDTDTIACMAGALAGALHGSAWLPARWLDNLENDEDGRDAMKGLARDLAQLDVRQ